ncbi:GNAT family N-acetyltransferase [Chloroflexota bacterium]
MSNLKQGMVNIRPMTRSDIRSILALDRKCSQERGVLSYSDMITTDPGGPLDVSFVAEVGGNIIGFVIARLAYVMIPFTKVCMLHSSLVDPDYQNRGIGIRLLGKLVDYCQDEGIDTIRALVEENNEELIRFVERQGFRRSIIVNFDKTIECK